MNSKEFREQFWLHYCLLEDEFSKTVSFVTVETDNFATYSAAYAKLLLEIGSEVDIALKNYCKFIDPSFSGNNIFQYKIFIQANREEFIHQKVKILNRDIEYEPWQSWSKQIDHTPSWWTVYNKNKHERTCIGEIDGVSKQYYKFANLKYSLEALAGLYAVLLNHYTELTEKERKKQISPQPLSRLFDLNGGAWKNVKFSSDSPFLYTVDGSIIYDRHSIL